MPQTKDKAVLLAERIMQYARNELLVALRFMDMALCRLEYQADGTETIASDGKRLYFQPQYVFQLYQAGSTELNHAYLHTLLHCIFYHPFVNREINPLLWDLACDIAVEAILAELNMKQLASGQTLPRAKELKELKKAYGKLTAERLYKAFERDGLYEEEYWRLRRLFQVDDHAIWYAEKPKAAESGKAQENGNAKLAGEADGEATSAALAAWQVISERVLVDLQTASQEWGDRSASLLQNIAEVNRETYDYSDFLRKFAVLGEEMQINDDEFDYIFYTYGLQLYENMPLIEPLEYKEVKRVRDFVVAIDTSGSVQGELVQKFINKTYNILTQQNSFFSKINVHIIQCDAEIQQDYKITSQAEFEEYLQNMELRGFGGTDFRPVFDYVDGLIRQGAFSNLKGLIYFTDGWGTFPERKPSYEAAFVFVDEGLDQENDFELEPPPLPVWAIKLVLRPEEI